MNSSKQTVLSGLKKWDLSPDILKRSIFEVMSIPVIYPGKIDHNTHHEHFNNLHLLYKYLEELEDD